MNISPRPAPLVGVLLAGALVLPAGALAKGGGGSNGPAPTPDAVQCDTSADGSPDGVTVIFSNQVGDAGCVTVIGNTSALRLYRLAVSPGWTAESDTTSTGVRVTFTQTATGYKASARIEPGKTDIRL